MTRLPGLTFILTAPLLAVLLSIEPASACAPAYRSGNYVEIASESALIIWDENSQTQHFIRRASFQTNSDDFGFLVPTPSIPKLSEANDAAFEKLEKTTAPKVVQQQIKPQRGFGAFAGAAPAGKAALADVTVIDSQRIAGQDVDILQVKSVEKLMHWLEDHGYAVRDSLRDWLKPYIDKEWYITVSKISRNDKKSPGVGMKAVCMSFKTDRPFYPYSEPIEKADNTKKNLNAQRLLRVYFIGPKRVDGMLEKQLWPGHTVYARPVTTETRTAVLGDLKVKDNLPDEWTLTEMEDYSSPRPGTADVYFSTANDQSSIERPPLVEYVYEEENTSFTQMVAIGVLVVLVTTLAVLALVLFVWLRPR